MKFEVQSWKLAFLLILISSSCEYFHKKTLNKSEDLVAKVGDSYLYYSDLEPMIKGAAGTRDSASIAKSYVEEWIKRKLMIQKALQYLPADKLDINGQVEDYRESLILYIYERELILQKMDTTVDENILLNYFDEFKTNFELKNDVVQMQYVKAPKDAPKVDSITLWIASKAEADKIKLADFCHQYASGYSLGDTVWYEIPSVYKSIPISSHQLETARLYKNMLMVSDSLFNYVMKINDLKVKNEIAPFHFVKDDIARIILNKRKNDLVRSTFENVYIEGKRNNKFEIYE